MLLVIWGIASGFWVQYVLGTWHAAVDTGRAQVAALDVCGRLYPPRPDGYASQYGNSWGAWLASEQHNHPECAPTVGQIGFLKFVGMQESERLAVRQNMLQADELATKAAFRAGWMAPVALLVFVGAFAFVFIRLLRR